MIGGTVLAGVPRAARSRWSSATTSPILTTRFGLDPDNHGVPTITATLDLTGVAAVLFVMSVLGVT